MRSILALAFVSGCAIGAPPGFSIGDTWTFPLVDPLADGKLITPVYIEGRGPYLFAIDPDAPRTVADREVIAAGQFPAHLGPRVIDEQDTTHPTFYAEVTNLAIGDLHVSLRKVQVSDDHSFDSDRRRIYGVLGRDVIADSLVFGFDRERGIAWLETQDTFRAPTDAQTLEYRKVTRPAGDLVVRRVVTAKVNDRSYDLHLDLGEVPSQLAPIRWPEVRLRPMVWNLTLIDETGTRRAVPAEGIASRVTVGSVTREQLGFVPYDDRRWDFGQLDGTLGLDFFRPFSVVADWHHERYYLRPRTDNPAQAQVRLARWGTLVPSCQTPGCISITTSTDAADVTRDPAAAGVNLEVVLAGTSATGQALPRLYVNLPAAVDHLTAPIEPRFAGAKLSVVDVSPFPYGCDGGCVAMDAPLPP